jgi:hypothetical protein
VDGQSCPTALRQGRLTLRSSGLPPARHLARAPVQVIIRLAGQAPSRRQPLSSNVRAHSRTTEPSNVARVWQNHQSLCRQKYWPRSKGASPSRQSSYCSRVGQVLRNKPSRQQSHPPGRSRALQRRHPKRQAARTLSPSHPAVGCRPERCHAQVPPSGLGFSSHCLHTWHIGLCAGSVPPRQHF